VEFGAVASITVIVNVDSEQEVLALN
jgi:hypothetical protein